MFAPAIEKSVDALGLLLNHRETLFFSTTSGYIPNVYNSDVFKKYAPFISTTHETSRN
jgi:hypothetical protein